LTAAASIAISDIQLFLLDRGTMKAKVSPAWSCHA
jgi:hypothetical protein